VKEGTFGKGYLGGAGKPLQARGSTVAPDFDVMGFPMVTQSAIVYFEGVLGVVNQRSLLAAGSLIEFAAKRAISSAQSCAVYSREQIRCR